MTTRKAAAKPRTPKITLPAVDLIGQWDAVEFRRCWAAASGAASKDKSRPVLTRVQFRCYPAGVMLFATDSYVTCGAWLGPGGRPDEYAAAADRTFTFDDRWGVFPKWLKEHPSKLQRGRMAKPVKAIRLVINDGHAIFDRADDHGNGTDEVRFPIDTDLIAYPDIVALGKSVRPPAPIDAIGLGAGFESASSIRAKAGADAVVVESTGDANSPQRWHLSGDAGHIRGLVMPVRFR